MDTRTAPQTAVVRWLLAGDPAIRWQVLRDLTDASAGAVAAERARVAREGWGARLLGRQGPDGHWGGGAWVRRSWASTLETLMELRELGLDPASMPARKAIDLLRERGTWGPYHRDAPFFEGETEPCINGRVLACGAYFAAVQDPGVSFEGRVLRCEPPRLLAHTFGSFVLKMKQRTRENDGTDREVPERPPIEKQRRQQP